MDYLTEAAWKAWSEHQSRYGSDFALLKAVWALPEQVVPFEKEPDLVLRLCQDLPIEMKHPIKMEATCWGLYLRRVEEGWRVVAIVPMFSKKTMDAYLDGGIYADEIVRRAA